MSALGALLGNISSNGIDVELMGGLNFTGGLVATPNEATERVDISLGSSVLTTLDAEKVRVNAVPQWFIRAPLGAPGAVAPYGSDANDGLTINSAFATTAKLNRVLSVDYSPSVNVVFNYGPGTFEQPNYPSIAIPSAVTVTVRGTKAPGSLITLSGTPIATNKATSTRGQISTASGAFVAHGRVRALTGAQAGAIAYSSGANGGATNHFVKEWLKPYTFAPVGVPAAIDVQVGEDLLTTFNAFTVRSAGSATGSGSFKVEDVILPNGGVFDFASVSGCDLGNAFVSNHSAFFNCRSINQCEFLGNTSFFFGCSFQHLIVIEQNATGLFQAGNCFDGGRALASLKGLLVFGATEYENGVAGNAIELFNPGSHGYASDKVWGASANYTTGVLVGPACSFVNNTQMQVSIPATTQGSLAGKTFLYSDVTKSLYTRAGASICIDPDSAATILST